MMWQWLWTHLRGPRPDCRAIEADPAIQRYTAEKERLTQRVLYLEQQAALLARTTDVIRQQSESRET